MKRRLLLALGGLFLVAVFGGIGIFWLNNNCVNLSQTNCKFMWGAFAAAIVGGTLLAEYVSTRQRTQQEHLHSIQTTSSHQPNNSNWYTSIRPIAWILISAMLVSTPLIIQGAYVLILFGVITGFMLNGVVRTVFNRLPSKEDKVNS